jgi:hypothetical protein
MPPLLPSKMCLLTVQEPLFWTAVYSDPFSFSASGDRRKLRHGRRPPSAVLLRRTGRRLLGQQAVITFGRAEVAGAHAAEVHHQFLQHHAGNHHPDFQRVIARLLQRMRNRRRTGANTGSYKRKAVCCCSPASRPETKNGQRLRCHQFFHLTHQSPANPFFRHFQIIL